MKILSYLAGNTGTSRAIQKLTATSLIGSGFSAGNHAGTMEKGNEPVRVPRQHFGSSFEQ